MFDSFWQIIEKGGIMMLPLGLASLIALAITLERYYSLSRVLPKSVFKDWQGFFKEKNTLPEAAKSVAKEAALSQVLTPLVPLLPLPVSRLEERFSDLSRKEKNKMEQGLVLLDTIAGVAPLLGLLGTALGMIRVFAQLSTTGAAKMEALSSGISEALFTTVTGLCIGIPALIAANLLSRHIDNLMLNLEDQLNQLLDENYQSFVDSK